MGRFPSQYILLNPYLSMRKSCNCGEKKVCVSLSSPVIQSRFFAGTQYTTRGKMKWQGVAENKTLLSRGLCHFLSFDSSLLTAAPTRDCFTAGNWLWMVTMSVFGSIRHSQLWFSVLSSVVLLSFIFNCDYDLITDKECDIFSYRSLTKTCLITWLGILSQLAQYELRIC